MHHDHDDHHDDHAAAHTTRRGFLRKAAATVALSGVSVAGMPRMVLGAQNGNLIVWVFMRGGADSLSLFPKYGDPGYRLRRPNIALPAPLAGDATTPVALDSMYAMNPNIAIMKEIWDAGNMAIAPVAHFNEGNGSHFDCQRWIELGGIRDNIQTGVLTRVIDQTSTTTDGLRALRAGTTSRADMFLGPRVVPAVGSAGDYTLRNNDFCTGTGCAENRLTATMAAIGARAIGPSAEILNRATETALVGSLDVVARAATGYVTNAGGLEYNDGEAGRRRTDMGRGLKLVAQLLKAGVPLEAVSVDWNGSWDTHENQLRPGQSPVDQSNGHNRSMAEGARDLVTFWRDLGPTLRRRVLVIVGSEFGRHALENGTFGTDHGFGGAWFAIGGNARTGIYRGTYSLETDIFRGRSSPPLSNYKDIIAEAFVDHLGQSEAQVASLFPGHTFTNLGMFG